MNFYINGLSYLKKKVRGAAWLLLLWLPVFSSAQTENWGDTIKNIFASKKSQREIIMNLSDKMVFLTNSGKREEASLFYKEIATRFKKEDAFAQANFYYCKTVFEQASLTFENKLVLVDSCIYFAEACKDPLVLTRGYRLRAQIMESNSDLERAESSAQKAVMYSGSTGNETEVAKSNYVYGQILIRQGSRKEAIKRILIALDFFEKTKQYFLVSAAYNTLANAFLEEKVFDKGYYYANGNKELCETNFPRRLARAYLTMATYFYQTNNPDSALVYYSKAEAAMYANNDLNELSTVYSNKATIFMNRSEKDSASAYFLKSIAEAEKKNIGGNLNRMYLNYASFADQNSDFETALLYIDKAINTSKIENDAFGYSSALEERALIYSRMKDYEKASGFYALTLKERDSINQKNRNDDFVRLSEEYESSKKQNEILKLNNERRIQQLELEKKNAIINGNVQEAKSKQNEIDLLNTEKMVSNLKLAQQKELLDRKTLENDAKEKALAYSEKEQLLKEKELTSQRMQKNMILAGSILLLSFVLLGFNQFRINQRRKSENEKHKLQHQLSELKLEALRAQMNPHFIFNALNSINRYIIRSDKETASDYLVKFSKLMRLILENSKSTSIPLQSELEALRLYVEMELLRFDNKFDFKLQVDETINRDQIFIPPLVLQPYVENAIWHGLLNKEASGSVKIEIKKIETDKLFCVIEDNGVGRVRAAELRSKTLGSSKSFGTQITKERINMLNGDGQNFRIIDLYDAQNNPSGTRVEIMLNYTKAAA